MDECREERKKNKNKTNLNGKLLSKNDVSTCKDDPLCVILQRLLEKSMEDILPTTRTDSPAMVSLISAINTGLPCFK